MEQTASKNAPFLRMDLAVRENATVLTKTVTISTDVCNQLDIHLLTKVLICSIISNLNDFLNASLSSNNSLKYQAKSVCRRVYL